MIIFKSVLTNNESNKLQNFGNLRKIRKTKNPWVQKMEKVWKTNVFEKLAEFLEALNLNRTEARIFLYLYLHDPIATQEEICKNLALPRSTVSQLLSTLKRLGMINWKTKEGKRHYYCTITPKELVLRLFQHHLKLREHLHRHVKNRLNELTGEERKMLETRIRLHAKIGDVLKKLEEEIDAL